MLDECTAIKNSLAISQETRPAWDMTVFKELGVQQVSVIQDVRHEVQKDPNLQYEEIPIFMIRVVK